MYMLWKSSLSLISTCIKHFYNDYGSEVDEYKTFLPKSERWPRPWKVVLTFESVDKILWCYHSNKTSAEVLSHGTILNSVFFQLWTKSVVWPFKWNSFGSTFTFCYLFSSILRNEFLWHNNFPLYSGICCTSWWRSSVESNWVKVWGQTSVSEKLLWCFCCKVKQLSITDHVL